jgi:hypothetical protein
LRLGLHCLQQAQRHLDEPWVCIADFTMQIGCKKALIVLRVPVSALSQGQALTLKQVEVIGLRLGETWNGARVNTVLLALFERCGWPSHVVSDCGSDIKKGIVETLLEAPKRHKTLLCQVVPLPAVSEPVHADAPTSSANAICLFAAP